MKAKACQHPGLLIETRFSFHQFLIEKLKSAFVHIGYPPKRRNLSASVNPHKDVGGHEMIAFAFLPPTPSAVIVLEIVQTIPDLFPPSD